MVNLDPYFVSVPIPTSSHMFGKGPQTKSVPHLGQPSPAELVDPENSVVLEGGEVDVALEDVDLEGLPLLGVQLPDLGGRVSGVSSQASTNSQAFGCKAGFAILTKSTRILKSGLRQDAKWVNRLL